MNKNIKTPSHKKPNTTPTYTPNLNNSAPKWFKKNINRYIYIWLKDGRGYWMFPISFRKGVLVGYIYKDDIWKLYQIKISEIDSFFN